MGNCFDKGYFLGVEYYYFSVALFDYLVSRKTDVIGAVCKNRIKGPTKGNHKCKIEERRSICII